MDHLDHHEIVSAVLFLIACEINKPPQRVLRLLLIKKNKKINRLFWEILDDFLPQHGYQHVGTCAECGAFELL